MKKVLEVQTEFNISRMAFTNISKKIVRRLQIKNTSENQLYLQQKIRIIFLNIYKAEKLPTRNPKSQKCKQNKKSQMKASNEKNQKKMIVMIENY